MNKQKPLDQDAAETIAIAALAFLAQEPSRLGQFLANTGMGPDALKASARTPETLAAVLNFLMQDESLLLTFTSEVHLAPEAIAPAYALLAGTQDFESSP